ncbi:hypothetical protein BDZ88DRAFT_319261 [Geranomyces variabilis]|nr:hypothetical protein BDZ88DRAFT_319261 [Geranomyces variabilis]
MAEGGVDDLEHSNKKRRKKLELDATSLPVPPANTKRKRTVEGERQEEENVDEEHNSSQEYDLVEAELAIPAGLDAAAESAWRSIVSAQTGDPSSLLAHRIFTANVPPDVEKLCAVLQNTMAFSIEARAPAPMWLSELSKAQPSVLEKAVDLFLLRGAAGVAKYLSKHDPSITGIDAHDKDLQRALSLLHNIKEAAQKRQLLMRTANERTVDLYVWAEFYKLLYGGEDHLLLHYGEARSESREVESGSVNNLDILLEDTRGLGRRGSEIALGESLGPSDLMSVEVQGKIVRGAVVCRDMVLRKAGEVDVRARPSVKVPYILQSHRHALVFQAEHLFANVVVLNFVGKFDNPILLGRNAMSVALDGARLFLHAKGIARQTANLSKATGHSVQSEMSLPGSTKKVKKVQPFVEWPARKPPQSPTPAHAQTSSRTVCKFLKEGKSANFCIPSGNYEA